MISNNLKKSGLLFSGGDGGAPDRVSLRSELLASHLGPIWSRSCKKSLVYRRFERFLVLSPLDGAGPSSPTEGKNSKTPTLHDGMPTRHPSHPVRVMELGIYMGCTVITLCLRSVSFFGAKSSLPGPYKARFGTQVNHEGLGCGASAVFLTPQVRPTCIGAQQTCTCTIQASSITATAQIRPHARKAPSRHRLATRTKVR